MLVVVICVTRVSVELILTEIVGNVGGFVILIVGCVVYIVASCCLLFWKGLDSFIVRILGRGYGVLPERELREQLFEPCAVDLIGP